MGNIQVIVRGLQGTVEKAVKRITLNATANFVEDTPVYTGFARANYVPQVGEPTKETVGTIEDAKKGKVNTAARDSAIAKIASSYSLDQGKVTIGNNTHYLPRLNGGSSKQAPAGFIQAGILRAVKKAGEDKDIEVVGL